MLYAAGCDWRTDASDWHVGRQQAAVLAPPPVVHIFSLKRPSSPVALHPIHNVCTCYKCFLRGKASKNISHEGVEPTTS